MRLLPRSFAGQLALLLLIALCVAQATAFFLFASERMRASRDYFHDTIVNRTATLLRLLDEIPADYHDRLLEAASSGFVSFWLSADPAAGEGGGMGSGFLLEDMARALSVPNDDVRARVLHRDPRPNAAAPEQADAHDGRPDAREKRRAWVTISVRSSQEQWLNAAVGPPPSPRPFGRAFFLSLALSALATGFVGVLVARRMVRPVVRLADAAERFGRGERPGPLPEEGPIEARRSLRAFNEMSERLDLFVRDRTRMLAAISHDLRTPITSLRLRAELVEDEETRERLIETVDEMQAMTEATLAFAQADQAAEETRPLDLSALVESMIEDLADLGQPVSTGTVAPNVVLRCRPTALRRALRNLIENAVRYGGGATIDLERAGGTILIRIAARGPGIPEAELGRVFEPFVRGEASRSRDTGGAGLGLAIARSILRAHGGDVALANRKQGGLEAVVRLPA